MAIFCAGLAIGCANTGASRDRFVGPAQSGDGKGDRNDIHVSVDAALGRAHVAPVGVSERSDGAYVWELRTAHDEPGELVVRVLEPETPGGPVPIEMECRVGRFGDAEIERLIVRSVSERLAQLRGRDYYRITWR